MTGLFIKYGLPSLAAVLIIFSAMKWREHDIQHWKNQGRIELTNEIAAAELEANKTIITKRRKIDHANKNLDHDALIRNGCKHGWVRDFENCPPNSR